MAYREVANFLENSLEIGYFYEKGLQLNPKVLSIISGITDRKLTNPG
jgi:hypothetical protein